MSLRNKVNKSRKVTESAPMIPAIGKYKLSTRISKFQRTYLGIASETTTLEELQGAMNELFKILQSKGYKDINITVGFREVQSGTIINRTKYFNLDDLSAYEDNQVISMLVDLFKLSLIENSSGELELSIAKSEDELKESLATFTKTKDFGEKLEISDMYTGVETYILNTNIFNVAIQRNEVGCTRVPGRLEKDRNHGILVKDTFKLRDYRVKNNNCLIDCFKRFKKEAKDGSNKQARTIKKQLFNLEEDSKLDLNIHTPVLEEYFGVKCAIVSHSEEVLTFTNGVKNGKDRFHPSNMSQFTCTISYNDTFMYGSEEADFWLYYEDDHVYPIESRFETKRCVQTGTPLVNNRPLSKGQVIHHLIKQDRLDPPDQKEKYTKPKDAKFTITYFMCIDFETIYDKFGTLSAYSSSAYGFVTEEEWREKGVQDAKTFYSIGKSCDIELYQYILSQKNAQIESKVIELGEDFKDYRLEFIILTWNGSRFDNFILAKTLSTVNALNTDSVFIAKNSILGLKFDGIKCIDMCRFIPFPLEAACGSFKIVNKKTDMGKSLTHEIIQARYFGINCNIQSFISVFSQEELKRMEHYNKMDCIAVIEIYFKFAGAFNILMQKLVDDKIISKIYRIFDCYTIPSLTYKLFADYLVTNKIEVPVPKTKEDWIFLKACIVGGRSQAFRTGKYEGKFASLDVKSLYPFAMISGLFPVGSYRKVFNGEGFDDITKMGFYMCKIRNQPSTKIIPKREQNGSLNWEYEGEIIMPLSSVDIRVLLEYGSEVDIGDGLLYDKVSSTLFSTFINVFKDEKTKQDKISKTPEYNPAIREICKLVMNSLAGKTQQAIFLDNGTIVANAKDAIKFINMHNKVIIKEIGNSAAIFIRGEKRLNTEEDKIMHYQSQAHPIQLGVLVYSYSRYHMYKSVLSKVETKFYTDTDSLHINMNEEDVLQLMNNQSTQTSLGAFKMGGEFGNFENEIPFNCTKSYYIAPKCYAMISEDGTKSKMRFKGVNKKDKAITSDQAIELIKRIKKLREQTTEECFNLYQSLTSAYSEEMFNKIIDDKEAYVLCSSIKKHLFQQTDQLFDLSARFIIKKISIKNSEIAIEGIVGSIEEADENSSSMLVSNGYHPGIDG